MVGLNTLAMVLLHGVGFLHPGHPDAAPITRVGWQFAWSWEPGIVIPLVITAVMYAVGSARAVSRNPRRPSIRGWQRASFWAGWAVLVLSLDSPLHKLGEALFSAHMTQHELLMVVAAPLLVFSKPMVAMLFALPESWRVELGRLSKVNAF